MSLRAKLLLGYMLFITTLVALGGWSAWHLREMGDVSRRIIANSQRPPAKPEVADFGLPHASRRAALATPIPIKGPGSAKGGQPGTLAMAAGLPDHVWTWREVWRYRVPPWPQPQTVSNMAPG
jgi:hypothetical protein